MNVLTTGLNSLFVFLNSTEAEYLSYPHGPFEHEVRLLNSLVLVLSHRLEHISTIGD